MKFAHIFPVLERLSRTVAGRLAPTSFLIACGAVSLSAATLTVAVDQPGAAINPAMWGVFFEDINFGADGGLYAELVKNPGFEFPDALMGWNTLSPSLAKGTVTVRSEDPFNVANPHYVRIQSEAAAPFGLTNGGYRGMGVKQGEAYNFSVRVRNVSGASQLKVSLYGGNGRLLDTVQLAGFAPEWKRHTATLHPAITDAKAWIAVALDGPGTLDLDFVSLFPEHTWKDRPAGLRADMVQALADMKPGFVRFPGGCIVEGSVLDRRYQWKTTLGPVEERRLLINRWNYEFVHRPAPDYFQSFGLGFFEFFQMCEDIGASPLPILNCGMACQFNSNELCPVDKLEPFIQDALDLIEFANGSVTSTWGAKRAALGHPAPFNVKMMGVGNEQWGPQYVERFVKFAEAVRAKHPEIKLVGAAGPSPDDERFKFLWSQMPVMKADIVDEHCYAKPEWFFDNAHRYDRYDRQGPKVFMGEYAAQSVETVSPLNQNTWLCALSEAAYMTGLERNADVVAMASYAPLFAHVDAWQWTPNLIWTDNLRTARTPSYHVQSLYARNRGDRVVPATLGGQSADEQKRLYATSAIDEKSGEVILKLVNATARESAVAVELAGVRQVKPGKLISLHADDVQAVNTVDAPDRVVPKESDFSPGAPKFSVNLPANSFTVVRVGVVK
jgi:alpha-L-arabinofuranosidase